ncbi:flavin reductase family protein [Rhodococcus sp. JS3073]|uniref:flavin reductase family protein n=1 Tax=Rhodococcus sp. JS3073 TaxID=3002901 RepID=UPI002286A1AC|nr:flavin reductase family protein [Rhodococcus sp. JS3073]WAM19420.1 flavin reductase family protein [Rhodococcus sp. JS3073]
MSLTQNVSESPVHADTIEQSLLRAVAGTFATGITIITCSTDEKEHGCAANAVLSVSLDPALMLISLAHTSRTRAAIEQAGSFAINILPDSAEGSDLCSLFASRSEDKFDQISHRRGKADTPILNGALGWLECAVETVQVAGDHTLIVGRVIDAEHGPGEPLVFFRGRHRRLAA